MEVHWKSCRRKESWHNSPGCTESWRKFMDSPMDTCIIDVNPADTQKVYRSWRRVPETQENLMNGPLAANNVDGKSWATRKVDRRPHDGMESWLKLTEGPTAAQNVDGRSLGCNNVSAWKSTVYSGKRTRLVPEGHNRRRCQLVPRRAQQRQDKWILSSGNWTIWVSRTKQNFLNYRVNEETRIVEEFFMSSG